MRFGPEDTLWLVTEPTPTSELVDILGETSLASLALQFKGGLTMAHRPTLFTDAAEAKLEAFGRLTALRAARAIAERIAASGERFQAAHRLEILDGEGKVVYAVDLPAQGDPDASRR